MDLLALLDMGRPSSPALGHLFLGLRTWTGPTPQLSGVSCLSSADCGTPQPLSHMSQFHIVSLPSCLSMHILLVRFSSLQERLGQVDVYAPIHLKGLGTSIPAVSPGQLSTGMGPKVSLQMGPQVGVVGVSRRCCQGSVWSSLSPPRDCPPGCPSLCMSGKDRRRPTCPPVSLQALDFSPFFLEAVRPPGRGREAGGADFHSRPATVLAFTELPAREPIRRVRDKARNRRNGNSAVRHGPTMQPHPSWP